ncbi:MAG: hypothetical protein LUQ06_06575, partial [Methylococcaceae bacterium]|nr:hypothetical protein [Methylococcaceae bacterium]
MNQELKQRLIAAVVVTALAAIFIPMLFDDPVDNSGQLVSELVIPTTSVKTDEVSANKLSTSANQVLNAPDAGAETVVNTKEEAELSANKQLPSDKSFTEEGIDQSADKPANDSSFMSLETGVVDQTNKPVKTKNTIQEAEPSKQKSTPKPHLEVNTVVAVPKKPEKKTERSTTTQATKVKPLPTVAANKNEKPLAKEATAKVIKPQPKEATAKVTKPQPKEVTAKVIKPQPKEVTAKVIKPQPKEATAKVTKPPAKEATAKVIKPQPKEATAKVT